jgi:hypothetical protein
MKNLKKRKATRSRADKRIVCESRSITDERQKMIEIQVAKRKQISSAEEKKNENRKRARKGELSYAEACKINTGNDDS